MQKKLFDVVYVKDTINKNFQNYNNLELLYDGINSIKDESLRNFFLDSFKNEYTLLFLKQKDFNVVNKDWIDWNFAISVFLGENLFLSGCSEDYLFEKSKSLFSVASKYLDKNTILELAEKMVNQNNFGGIISFALLETLISTEEKKEFINNAFKKICIAENKRNIISPYIMKESKEAEGFPLLFHWIFKNFYNDYKDYFEESFVKLFKAKDDVNFGKDIFDKFAFSPIIDKDLKTPNNNKGVKV